MAVESAISDARIIIVDDEWPNVRLLERVLKKEGYTNVLGLTDSSSLLEDQTVRGADLILLDLHMPKPNGFEVLESLKELDSRDQIPVLVLTADATAGSRNRALDIGASDYVRKPFDPVEVLLRVRNLLRTRFLYRRLLMTNRVLQDRLLELEKE